MRAAAPPLLALLLALAVPAGALGRAYSGDDLALIARRVFERVNEARVAGGLPALAWSGAVAAVAEGHAADMARRGYFGHRTPEGRGHGDRARAAGVSFRRYGENILKVDGPREAPEALARTIAEGFLASPAHRGGILTPDFESTGVGVGRSPVSGAILVVQNFLDPPGTGDAPAARRGKRTFRLPFGIKLPRW